MAINPVPVRISSDLSTGAAITINGSNETDTFDDWAAPTAGNLIVVGYCARSDTGTTNNVTWPTGFSEITNTNTGNGIARGGLAFKVADGSESSLTLTLHSSDIFTSVVGFAAEFEATDLDLSNYEATNDGQSSSANSVATGAASNTTADALCITLLGMRRMSSWNNGSRSANNSYTERHLHNSGTTSNVALAVATKVVASTGDQGCTWSQTDTVDSDYAAVVIFGASAAGGHTKLSGKLGYPLRGKLG